MKDHITIRIESPAFEPDAVRVAELTGTESIARLFELQLRLVSLDPAALDEEKLLTSPMAVVFERTDGVTGIVTEERRMVGMVCTLRDRTLADAAGREVLVTFVPRAWQATLTRTSDIFMDLTVPAIIQKKLQSGAGLAPGRDVELRLKATYPVREFVVQYKESDWDFVSRLAEDLGIHFFWEVKDDRDVLVLADDNSAFKDATPAVTPFSGRGDRVDVYELEATRQVVPRRFQARDYNYRNPAMDLLGEAQITTIAGGGVVDEFGPHVKTGEEATFYARIRAEEAGARHLVFEGTADLPGLRAGSALTVTGHPRGELELVVIEVRHHATQATFGHAVEGHVPYRATFRAIPGATPFRPARITPKPIVHGVVTGIVEAAAATNFGAIDEEGRYRVAFMYDTVSGRGEGKASRPLRMAQPSAAADRGFHVPLKPGTEVVITCVNGDPDRPIIAGAVPNPQTPSPVTAANAEKSMWKTNVNAIAIDDDKPRMKMTVNGEDHVFQIGEPNAPEFGAVMGTIGNASSMVNGVSTAYSSAATAYQDYKTSSTGKNILEAAGIPNPWSVWKKLETVATQAVGTIKAAATALDQAHQVWTDLDTGFKEKKTNAAASKKKADEALDKTKKDLVAALHLEQAAKPIPKANDDGTTRMETEAEARDRALKDALARPENNAHAIILQDKATAAEEAAGEVTAADEDLKLYEEAPLREVTKAVTTGAGHAETALGALKSGQTVVEALATANKVATAVATAIIALKPGEKLFSKISDILSKGTQKTLDVTVSTSQKAAGRVVKLTGERESPDVASFAKPYNIQFSRDSAALYGARNAFVFGGRNVSVFSAQNVNVTANTRVDLKARKFVEIAAKDVWVTSTDEMDLHSSATVRIVADTGAKKAKPPAGNTMYLRSKEGILLESLEKDIVAKAKKNVKLEAEDENLEAKAKKAVKVEAQEGDIELVATKGKVTVRAADANLLALAKKDCIVKSSDGNLNLIAEKGQGTIKTKKDLKVAADGDLSVKAKKVKIKASKIHLQ